MSLTLFKHQRGAILIFSLVFLLLLTLISVSMIQQSQTQLTTTYNTGAQMRTFADAETALTLAESGIETTRYQDMALKTTCKSTDHLYENSPITLPSSTGATAVIVGTYCVIYSYEYRCVGTSSYTAEDPLSSDNVNACDKLTAAQCPTELYTIDVTLTDNQTNSQRVIRSKYAVGCEVAA